MKAFSCSLRVNLALTALALLGLVTSRPATAADFYSLTDLGVGVAEDLNDQGQVVGALGDYSGGYNHNGLSGFLWSQNQGFTDLGTFGGDTTFPYGINNLSQVVGNAYKANGESLAFLWSKSTGLTDIGQLGIPYFGDNASRANAINDQGQVVGTSNTEGFLWTKSTGFTIIPGIRSGGVFPSDINNAGQVVGSSGNASNGSTAFLWSESTGSPTDLTPFGGPYAGASAINDMGQVVGSFNEGRQAFIWNKNTGITDIGKLSQGNSYVFPNDINNSNQVVGYSQIASGDFGSHHAFLWEDGVITDLNNLVDDRAGIELSEARAINNRGQIVGYGSLNGESHAFLLTPKSSGSKSVPEPDIAWSLLTFGALGLMSLVKLK